MTLERLVTAGNLTVDMAKGTGGELVIAFSSIGHDPSRPPAPEFLATATGRGTPAFPRRALFVSDAGRSWASDPGFGPALRQALEGVQARAPVDRILTLGLSMGAYAALVAARHIPVDVVLAFGPQWSPLPGVIAGETRWADWTARLQSPPGWPATAPLPDAAKGWAVVCHGLVDDQDQAMAFPVQPGTDHLLFPGLTHSGLVPQLKARGGLSGLVDAALAGDRRRLLRIATAAGGIRRK